MMTEQSLIYQFDSISVDIQAFRVLRDGKPVALEPKAIALLLFLMENPGRLVTKTELLDAVWKETAVTENALTRIIAQLRKGLGDDAKEARYIETVPTKGYRFLPAVTIQTEAAGSTFKAEAQANKPEISLNGSLTGSVARGDLSSAPAALLETAVWRPPFYKIAVAVGVLTILSVVVVTVLKPSPAPAPKMSEWVGVHRMLQLTTSSGLDLHPTFSPDGSSLAYASDRNGNFEIYIKQLTSGGREIQLTSDGAQNFQPAWSPDGRQIAYYAKNRGGIWLMPALGGSAKQLTTFGSHPTWSPDGTQIAFQSDGLADLSQTAYEALSPSTLWIVQVQGGTPTQMTQIGTPLGGHGSPNWSPDGKRIVFVAQDARLCEIWSISAQGRDLKRISQQAQPYYNPVYSPDGKSLFYSTAAENFRLWKLPLSLETGEPSGDPIEVANTGLGLCKHLALSLDGKKIACSMLSMNCNLWSIPVSPTTQEPLGSPRPLTQDTSRRKTVPTFSPDGQKVVYRIQRVGEKGENWLIHADGSQAMQLPLEATLFLGWLPDGKLACVSQRQNSLHLFSFDPDTSQESLIKKIPMERQGQETGGILVNGYGGFAKISPDGKQIILTSIKNGIVNLWTISFVNGEIKQLTFDQELMGFPHYSLDGKLIALEMKRGENTYLGVVPSSGGPVTQINFDPGQSWPGGWSPDGSKISFAGFRKNVWNVWWISLDGKAQKQLTNYTKTNSYVRFPAWSPLGNQIVYEYGETTGNIWVIELN